MKSLISCLFVLSIALSGCMAPSDGSSVTDASTQGGSNGGGGSGGGTTGTGAGTGNCGGPFVAGCTSGGGGGSSGLVGSLNWDQQTGQITGTAYEQSNSSVVISVELYINGPPGTGTLLTTVSANQVVINGGNADGFIYTPSATYVDSTPRKLYAYMLMPGTGSQVLIGGAAYDYFAGPDAKGLAYFNANLQTTLTNNCKSCHQSEWANYYTTRGLLGSPTPLSGGTATNNLFYMYASGVNHPGGNQCSGNSLCTTLATWWGMDFGK